MDTKALRQKILDLAIRGKLVPQDPTDEPASVLLERIREEKNQMVKDGKLKAKDIKNDTIIFKGDDNLHYEKFQDGTVKCIEDEIPFEVPDSWRWTRLCSLAVCISDGDHQPPPQVSLGIPFLVISNVSGGYLSFDNTRFVSEDYYESLPSTRKPCIGDLLFTVTGSYGITIPVDIDRLFCFQRHIALIRPCLVSNKYLSVMLSTTYIKAICDDKATGTAQKTVGLATLRDILIPVAPIEEQARICETYDKADILTNLIQKSKDDLQASIDKTKKKILELAIRGQLLPQNPNDESASVLLERIRADKEELVKQGKLKRDKKESIIYKGDDNSYYGELDIQIPQAWKIVSLQEINTYCTVSINPALNPEATYELYSVPIYETGYPEIIKGKEIGSTKQQIQKDDVLISKINPRINRVWRNHKFTDNNTICSSEWIVFRNSNLYAPYMQIYFMSPFFRKYMLSNVSGVGGSLMRAQPESVRKYPVIIPPYNEQVRIVSLYRKINEQLNCIKHKLE